MFKKLYGAISTERLTILEKPTDMAKLIFSGEGVFLSTKELFEGKIINRYDYTKRSVDIRLNDKKSQDEIIRALIDG
jgi:hypothetical protein